MAKPTDRKTIAIEKIACSSQLPRGRGMTCPMGPHGGSARASQEAEGARWRCGQLYCGCCEKDGGRQGKQIWDWVISVDSGVLGLAWAVWYLALRLVGQENSGLE